MITMRLFFLCLLATPAAVHGGTTEALLTMQPTWTRFFSYEKVTLKCKIIPYKYPYHCKFCDESGYCRDGEFWHYKDYCSIQITTRYSEKFYCEVNGGIKSNTINLIVTDNYSPLLTLEPEPTEIFEMDTVTMRCRCRYNNNVRLTWYKGGMEKHSNSSKSSAGVTYRIISVSMSDSDIYTCRGCHSYYNSPKSNIITLQVSERPKAVLKIEVECSDFKKKKVKLRCEIPGKYNDWEYEFNKNRNIIKTNWNNVFEIEHIPRYEYQYTCQGHLERPPSYSKLSDPITLTPGGEAITEPILEFSQNQVWEGDLVTLHCDTQVNRWYAVSSLRYTYYKDQEILKTVLNESTLELRLTRFNDMGKYSCRVTNEGTECTRSSNPVTLHVSELISSVILQADPTAFVREGQPLILTCSANVMKPHFTEPLLYTFLKDGEPVKESSSSAQYTTTANESHAGKYECEGQLNTVTKRSLPVSVHVQIPVSTPVMVISGNRTTSPGDSLHISCQSSRGTDPIHYQLYFKNQQNNNIQLTEDSKPISYKLKITGEVQTGSYWCRANNSEEDEPALSNAINITVIEKPKVNRQNSRLPAVPTAPPMDEWREENNPVPAASSDDRFPIDDQPTGEGVVYSMVDIKKTTGANWKESKGRTGSANSDSVEYYVTYAKVNVRGSVKKNVHASEEEEEGGTDDEAERQEERKILEDVRENVYCNSENLYENFKMN
ncbi:Fc receptor-like protein 5 isoform X2 [Erpetoichthys calabaricus]|uniref:Fc receptor-like protein 5 isoform X2 n=1 Tax=Erpetoichthys calabaricus TaxID=27687 RepID=UPI00109FCB3D|nr:Fc receptor-like protein 5 isoform X2 [Erpetoichthys calabaricus]